MLYCVKVCEKCLYSEIIPQRSGSLKKNGAFKLGNGDFLTAKITVVGSSVASFISDIMSHS